jgi:hypothetical protein
MSTLQFLCRYTKAGWSLRIRLHDDSSPTPAGIHVNACQSYAMTDSNSLKGIPAVSLVPSHIQLLRIVRSFSLFANSSHIVFAEPSKSKPSSVFWVKYCSSSLISFLSDIGLLLSLSSREKTSCIPITTAVATRHSCSCETGITRLMKSST